ncbi:MGMT family protein [Candidatus Gracilibacteria bacterium]|nr:MGMT family protein [Candidatus Gracilibacteria bacterium]
MIDLKQDILEELQRIPVGKVMTYKTMADKFKVHPRKVAMVMKHNEFPDIYPCYKVISHSGKLGGYSGKNGIHGKVQRLRDDGIEVVDGKIDPKYII